MSLTIFSIKLIQPLTKMVVCQIITHTILLQKIKMAIGQRYKLGTGNSKPQYKCPRRLLIPRGHHQHPNAIDITSDNSNKKDSHITQKQQHGLKDATSSKCIDIEYAPVDNKVMLAIHDKLLHNASVTKFLLSNITFPKSINGCVK